MKTEIGRLIKKLTGERYIRIKGKEGSRRTGKGGGLGGGNVWRKIGFLRIGKKGVFWMVRSKEVEYVRRSSKGGGSQLKNRTEGKGQETPRV